MDKKEKKERKIKSMTKKISEIWQNSSAEVTDDIASDILGSYTGNPRDSSVPEQDADDL